MRKKRIKNILDEWGDKCILCGEKFSNRECITREHLIPRSKGRGFPHNLALSHYNCNHLRDNLSVIDAIYLIKEKREKLGEENFRRWINKKVPNKDKKMKRESPKEIAEFQKSAPIPSDEKLRVFAERVSKLCGHLQENAAWNDLDVTTTSGDVFTGKQSAELAYLIYLRFGKDIGAAHSAWQRMLQNNCSLRSFQSSLETGVSLHLQD